MKKLLIGIIAALLMTGGLVATTTTSAVAGPYTGTVKTDTEVKPLQARPFHARLKVGLDANKGDKDPQGTIVFTFVNKRTGKVTRFVANASDGPVYSFDGLKPGKYEVAVKFKPRKGSKWKPSSESAEVTVDGRG